MGTGGVWLKDDWPIQPGIAIFRVVSARYFSYISVICIIVEKSTDLERP